MSYRIPRFKDSMLLENAEVTRQITPGKAQLLHSPRKSLPRYKTHAKIAVNKSKQMLCERIRTTLAEEFGPENIICSFTNCWFTQRKLNVIQPGIWQCLTIFRNQETLCADQWRLIVCFWTKGTYERSYTLSRKKIKYCVQLWKNVELQEPSWFTIV